MTHPCTQDDRLKTISTKCDTHISWAVFWSIIILLVGLTTTALNVLNARISTNLAKIEINKDELLSKQTDQAIISARIETQLQRIQLDLAEISINIKKIK